MAIVEPTQHIRLYRRKKQSLPTKSFTQNVTVGLGPNSTLNIERKIRISFALDPEMIIMWFWKPGRDSILMRTPDPGLNRGQATQLELP